MLNDKDKRVLSVLADDYETNPSEHLRKGIPRNTLGAASDAYLNNVMYEVEHLIRGGYANRLNALDRSSNVIITKKGYQYIRPPHVRLFHWITGHKTITVVAAIVGLVGIIVGLINIFKSCSG